MKKIFGGTNKMKKAIILLALILMINLVSAQITITKTETENNELMDEAGILPDSAMYNIDLLLEWWRLRLSDEGISKIEYRLKLAEERMSEIRVMANKPYIDGEKLQLALTNREQLMNEIATKSEYLNEELKQSIQTRLQSKAETHKQYLQQISETYPENIKQRIQISVNNAIKQQTQIKQAIKNVGGEK